MLPGLGKLYIQSAFAIPNSAKLEQKTAHLRSIPDSFPKIVVVGGLQPVYTDIYGVTYVSILEFMLNKDFLGHYLPANPATHGEFEK